MNKRIPYILISVLILSVGETALAQVKVEESISTKALVKRGSRDVLRTGVIDLTRGHYRDSLVNYFTIQQGTGDEAEYYTYHDAIFGENTLSYKERRPQVRYRSKDEEMIEFTSHSYPYHKYFLCFIKSRFIEAKLHIFSDMLTDFNCIINELFCLNFM